MIDTSAIPKLRPRDMMTVEDLFIRDGYVIRFSEGQTAFGDRTFAEFFRDELNINIDDPKWSAEGSSKGKRLRFFLRNVEAATVVKTLKALWGHREIFRQRHGISESVQNAGERLEEVLAHLGGATKEEAPVSARKNGFQHIKYDVIYRALLSLTDRPPQERGYQFEKFLKKTFDAFGLEAERAFRLTGEQIDGSFVLDGDTYLMEAKWQNERTGVADLHVFHGKLDQRAAWGRGLFVSYSGFTEDGLIAFGRARKVICLDGRDLSETFQRELPLPEVLRRKVRKAVEHGVTLARVADLFP
jgi:hypothetical protein